jgi:hypothetical protein|tara:strand:+ start:335 stop:574 length:240 start_codon:yes stop_codon:yes gene_type:complete
MSTRTSSINLYTYTDHDEIPRDLWDYMTSVADIDHSLTEVPIKEINEFLNFVETEGEMGLPDEELETVSPDPRQLELEL